MNDPTTSPRDPATRPAPRRPGPPRAATWPGPPDPRRTSLAEVRAGDVVEVIEIFFEIVRNHCWALGLVVGDVCECVAVGKAEIVLAHPTGGRLKVERDCARFVLTRPRALALGITGTPGPGGVGQAARGGDDG